MRYKSKGLTLIELLVVITIIGLLAGVFAINVSKWRVRTRDSQRVSDIRTWQQGLALYFYRGEYIGSYPDYDIFITGSDSLSSELKTIGAMSTAPADPINSGNYRYYYCTKQANCSGLSGGAGTGFPDGTSYILMYYLETNSIQGKSQGQNYATP